MSLERKRNESLQRKAERMKEIFHGVQPDAVVILSADIVEAPERTIGYKSGSYADLDVRDLLSGAKARVIAGAEASKYFQDAEIVTDTRDRDLSRGRPTHAAVYADELRRLGVDQSRIVMEEESVNTIEELIETIKMAEQRNWKEVALISNDYHVPRIRELYARLEDFAQAHDTEFWNAYTAFQIGNRSLQVVSAEDILPVRNPRYSRLIQEVHSLPEYGARVRAEQKGIEDLRNNKYKIGKRIKCGRDPSAPFIFAELWHSHPGQVATSTQGDDRCGLPICLRTKTAFA